MEDLSHGHGRVPVVLEMLRQACVIAGDMPPVAVKVVEPQGVRSPAGQQGVPARSAQCLLQIFGKCNCFEIRVAKVSGVIAWNLLLQIY